MIELERYFGWAHYWASKWHRNLGQSAKAAVERNDLVQEALLGLVKAAQQYNPTRGVKFINFATLCIDHAIIDYLRKAGPLTPMEREKFRQLEEVKRELIGSLARPPSTEEVAGDLGISVEDVLKIEELSIVIYPLDPPPDDGEGTGEGPIRLSDPTAPDPERETMGWELGKATDDCLKTALTEREQQVFILRVGAELTLEEVGKKLGIRHVGDVQRRQLDAHRKLKGCLEAKGWTVHETRTLDSSTPGRRPA